MNKHFLLSLLLGCGLLGSGLPSAAQNIIPRPSGYEAATGQFTFAEGTVVACEGLPDSLKTEALRFVGAFETASGLDLATAATAEGGVTCLHGSYDTYGAEGYKLAVAPEGITVEAATSAGYFYAFQSLKMLLPRNVMAEKADAGVTAYAAPACTITDSPRFAYRGFMLDCARHFFTIDEVKRVLDVMAYYKMNRFHWHLTDDQGWRMEMPKYPRLQTVAAARQGSWNVDPEYGRYYVADQYGPYYYTIEQMKEIVAYAAERHIEVIPEVEMPGHLCAAITAYPEFSCNPYGAHRVWNDGGVSTDVLDISNPKAIQFCKDVLDELVEIFPYEYIHIGGDECPTSAWESSASCQALKEELGYTNIRGLQSHFTHELAQYMATKEDPAKRRKLIAWNESVTAGGSDTELLKGDDLTIMCWVGAENASNVAENLGMTTILTPQPAWYINRKQSPRPGEVHNAGSGTDATLEIVYNNRPTVRSKTMGVQGTFWCEHVSSDWLLEYQALPRLIAIAEVGWTQDNLRDFDNFLTRLRVDTTLLNYGDYAWCDYLVKDESGQKVMPAEGTYYQLMSRAASPREGRCITLLSEGAPALEQYAANGAKVGLLWSDTAISDAGSALRPYQMWQFVEDPSNPGKYAMVCQAKPEGSVVPTASSETTDGTWSYDETTRHYNFVLGESSYYGKDGTNYYYSIRSDQYDGLYMNMAAAGKQLRINVYNNPADGNGGLFTFMPDATDEEQVMPEAGQYYRVVTQATDTRGGRCVELVAEGSALTTDEATQATPGQLWSAQPVTDKADARYAHQMWQFVEDPSNPGLYAMVNQAEPDGSVSPTATSTELTGRWTYDATARHYAFRLGENGFYGETSDGNYYYSIRSTEYDGYYFNSAGAGQKLAINIYNRPDDTSAGLFALEPEGAEAEDDAQYVEDGQTYRIEVTATPEWTGLRLSDNGRNTLGYSTQPWCNDAWIVTATAGSAGRQTITLTNAATGRAVSTTTNPVQLGSEAASLTLTWNAETEAYTIGSGQNLFIPIGEGYAVDPGTISPTSGALVPQGSNWTFTPVATATYTAKDEDGKLLGTFTQSIALGQPYTPEAPVINGYECTTDASELTGSDAVDGNLTYDVVYRRTSYAATLRAVEQNGLLIATEAQSVPAAEATYAWTAPELDWYTYDQASATPSLALVSDTTITLTYTTEAVPSFAEALEEVTEIEDGAYYLIYNNDNRTDNRNGYLGINPLTGVITASYMLSGSPLQVWRAEQSGTGFKLRSSDGRYIPQLPNGGQTTVGDEGDTFTFTYDGADWAIRGTNGRYFDGNGGGGFTGWSSTSPVSYKVFTFRTEPYYALTYVCRDITGANVGRGTYTVFYAAGESYTLDCPVEAPAAYPYVTHDAEAESGTMTGNLTVTYTFSDTSTGINGAPTADPAADAPWYDLSGRRLNGRPATSGVYIHGTQKVFVK